MDKELAARLSITIEAWAERAITAIARELKEKGVTFSGGSESELIGSAEVKTNIRNLGVQILLNDYWVYVDQGRRPGPVSEQGKKKIERWVKRKGINSFKNPNNLPFDKHLKSISFLITRKLKSFGYKGKFFMDAAITQRLVDELASDVAETIEDYLTDTLSK